MRSKIFQTSFVFCAGAFVSILPLCQPLAAQPETPAPSTPAPAPSTPAPATVPLESQPEVLAFVVKGQEARQQGKVVESRQAFDEALAKARALKDKAGEALALSSIGFLLDTQMAQSQESLEFYTPALLLYQEIGDRDAELNTLNNIGFALTRMGQPEKALEVFEKLFQGMKQAGNKLGEGLALLNIGTALNSIRQPQRAQENSSRANAASMKRWPVCARAKTRRARPGCSTTLAYLLDTRMNQAREALDFYVPAVSLYREIGDKAVATNTLNNIGVIYNKIGQPEMALKIFEKVASEWKQAGDKMGVATALHNIGSVHENSGQPRRALEFYERVLLMMKEAGNKAGMANSLNNIGTAYNSIGQPQKALEFGLRALQMMQETGNKAGLATSLNNLGLVYSSIGQPEMALVCYQQSLPLRREIGDKRGEAITLGNLGGAYADVGETQKALDFYDRALRLYLQLGDTGGAAYMLNNKGLLWFHNRQYRRALQNYEKALPLMREVHNKGLEATTLNNMGAIYRDLKQPRQALRFSERALGPTAKSAIRLVKQALSTTSPSPTKTWAICKKRSGFASVAWPSLKRLVNRSAPHRKTRATSSNSITTCITATSACCCGRTARSRLSTGRRRQARALIDLMSSGKVDISKGISAQDRERERNLKWQIGQLNRQMVDEATGRSPDKARFRSLKWQVRQMGVRLNNLTDELYIKYPGLARKRAARTVSLQDVARFLPPDTALLEYVVLRQLDPARRKAVLFCVTVQNGKASVTAYPIARTDAQLTKLARAFHAVCADLSKDYRGQARSSCFADSARRAAVGGQEAAHRVPGRAAVGRAFSGIDDGERQRPKERLALPYRAARSGLRFQRDGSAGGAVGQGRSETCPT